jgi:hypothetical protein
MCAFCQRYPNVARHTCSSRLHTHSCRTCRTCRTRPHCYNGVHVTPLQVYEFKTCYRSDEDPWVGCILSAWEKKTGKRSVCSDTLRASAQPTHDEHEGDGEPSQPSASPQQGEDEVSPAPSLHVDSGGAAVRHGSHKSFYNPADKVRKAVVVMMVVVYQGSLHRSVSTIDMLVRRDAHGGTSLNAISLYATPLCNTSMRHLSVQYIFVRHLCATQHISVRQR